MAVVVLHCARAAAWDIRVSSAAGVAGSDVNVVVSLSDAAGLASLGLKVNYDPVLLDLLAVTNAASPIGRVFQTRWNGEPGTAGIALAADQAITQGNGPVLVLTFRVCAGAVQGGSAEIAVAMAAAGSEFGLAMAARDSAAAGAARVWVVPSMTADTFGCGLPDWWQLACFGAVANRDRNGDSDGDGSNDGHELAAGTDPLDGTDAFQMVALKQDSSTEGVILRWASVLDKVYSVERSTNLSAGFSTLEPGIPATPPENVYTDLTACAVGPFFYRIKTE
jgi:hypothetical protein